MTGRKLTEEGEYRDGFYVTPQAKRLWNVQLQMLQRLLEVCEKHNLKVFLSGGTLLGAVRHKGYIPWDDDIDVDMPREDYDKLVALAPAEFKDPYFFQCAYTEDGYYRGHAQIRYKGTAQVLPHEVYSDFNQGIFLDIFVLDHVPDTPKQWHKVVRQTKYIQTFLWFRKNKYMFFLKPMKWVKSYLRVLFMGISWSTPDRELFQRYEDILRNPAYRDCKRIGCLCLAPSRKNESWFFDRHCFDESVYLDFEYMKFPAPAGYHAVLTTLYGDYMTPVQCPSMHGDTLSSADEDYTKVLKRERKPLLRLIGATYKKRFMKLPKKLFGHK